MASSGAAYTTSAGRNRRGPPGWNFSSYPASRTSVSFDGTAYEGFGHAESHFQLPAGGGAMEVRRWWAPHSAFILAAAILPAVYAVRRRLAQQRADEARPLPRLRSRPHRHPRPLPPVRGDAAAEGEGAG